MAEIEIRIISKSDIHCLDEVKRLFRLMYDYLETKGQLLPLVKNGENLWMKAISPMLGRFGILIGAFENSNLIGFVHGSIKVSPDYLGNNKLGFLSHQYIVKDRRDKGIGNLLIRELEKWFEEQDVHSVEIQSNYLNCKAKSFYKKYGYENELIQFRKILKP